MTDNIEELQKQLAQAQQEAAKWQGLHAQATIKRELREAAEKGGAFNADQLMPYLTPNAKLVEDNGQHVVRVIVVGQDGKEIHHTPAQAVAHMKQNKDFENLFKSAPAAPPASTAPGKIDWSNMTAEQYRELRKKHPERIGLAPKSRY
jgi:hypothetical protein